MLIRNLKLIIYMAVCVITCFLSFNQARSQYFTDASRGAPSDAFALKAIHADSGNPDALKVRAIFHLNKEKFREAIPDLEKSIKLRPTDYLLWLRLGYARYKLAEYDRASKDFDKAISLAPNYGMPLRYKGRLLLKINKTEQAFVYLSKAAALERTFLPEVLHLARKAYPENPELIEKAVNPVSNEAKVATAFYLIKHRMMSDSSYKFITGNKVSKELKNEFSSVLIARKDFERAYAVWNSQKKEKEKGGNLVLNGDFEMEINPNEKSFGWILSEQAENTSFSVDTAQPFSEKVALRVTFDGKSDPGKPVLSQLIPVEPNRSYSLSFSARSEEIVTGGLPVIAVADAASGAVIKKSATLTGSKWQGYRLDFTTGDSIKAVRISLERLPCSSDPCPVFGKLWLDKFVMR